MNPSSPELDFSHIDEDLDRFQQDEVVKEALSKGVDLRQYARQVDADLLGLGISSIPDYIAQAPAVAKLHSEISECDRILESMQSILQGFQTDLGGISDEIKTLQDKSLSMNAKLKNRRAVERTFNRYLDELVVPDSLIVQICQGKMGDDYLRALQQLDLKIAFARSQEPVIFARDGSQPQHQHVSPESNTTSTSNQEVLSNMSMLAPCDTAIAQDVEPQLEKLRLKAVSNVRTFLLARMEELRKPNTNVQMMQQSVLLKHRYCNVFLARHAPAVAEEVKATYVDIMGRIIFTLFKSYQTNLAKLEIPGPPKELNVTTDDVRLRRARAEPQGPNIGSKAQSTLDLSLADREALLGEPDSPPIIVHVAAAQHTRVPFESIFRSIQKHLIDSATSEYLFTLEFFGSAKVSKHVFNAIFLRTLSLCLEHLENHLHKTTDLAGLLLLIRTTQAHHLIMEKRKVPCLDGYLDRVNLTLWPYFKRLFGLNLDAMRSVSVRQLGNVSLSSHYVSPQYAVFSSTVFALCSSLTLSDEGIPISLAQLRDSFESLLGRLADAAHSNGYVAGADVKARSTFLINNYDAVLQAYSEVPNACSPDDSQRFEELLGHETANFVETQLTECYGGMIMFVKNSDAAAGGGGGGGDGENNSVAESTKAEVERLVNDFANTWRSGLQLIDSQVESLFASSSSENARLILQKAVAQLLLYYTRFQEIVRANHPDLASKLLPYQEIREEIRQCIRQPRH